MDMIDAKPSLHVIGQDRRMARVFELVDAVADSRATVLITGESGTGKSLIARAIHERSCRRAGPFVEVCCGALPEMLLESELFGHVRGAFTDAAFDRAGKFAAADGGTIFLDEISNAPPILQLKLLRVLQERQFEPVGSNRTASVDVRVILACNRDLWQEVEAGRFRRDLYYRVNVVNIELPPLRQRQADVVLLAQHFLRRFQQENAKVIWGFAVEAIEAMKRYSWPGNVRELENCVERAVVLCRSGRVDVEDLPDSVRHGDAAPARHGGTPSAEAVAGERVNSANDHANLKLSQALAGPEREIIRAALRHNGGSRQLTAQELGIDRTTLYKKMKRHGLLDA